MKTNSEKMIEYCDGHKKSIIDMRQAHRYNQIEAELRDMDLTPGQLNTLNGILSRKASKVASEHLKKRISVF